MVKRGRFLLGLLISAVFLLWALSGLKLDEFWQQLQQANYWWLLPGVAVYFIGVWARTWRWHYMLRPLKPIPLSRLFPVVCIGYAGNNIYPARAGEVLRAYILKQQDGVSVSANLATVVVERIFDGLVMLAFVVFALPFTDIGTVYRDFVLAFSALFLGALLAFLLMAARPAWAHAVVGLVLRLLVPLRFHEKVTDLVTRFLEGLGSLRNGRDVLMIFGTSVIVWLLETLKYWFVMHAFPFEVSFIVLMLMNGIVNLTTSLPAAPGHIGTFDTPGIKVLQAFGVEQAVATSYTLVLHAALWLPITALGLFYLGRTQLNIQRVRQEVVRETAISSQ
ncbi:MAG: flippase-like domain-containing protein [Chloroflexota bacterium]|nr:flippase-like domain-containing protein [Chloroflexota bacterium]